MVTYTLGEIAKFIQAKFTGDENLVITGVATLQSANEKQISFLDNKKYEVFLTTTKAAAVILNDKNAMSYSGNALIVEDPYFAFAKATTLFMQVPQVDNGIHATAVIGKNCKIAPSVKIGANVVIENNVSIGANTQIHPGCVIGNDCQIGADCCLWPNVTIYYKTKIGNQVNIHSGAVLGADGFGWAQHKGQWHKVPQLGGVTIEDDVDIGANTTIDRGTLDDTVIETGVRLDNHIQVAHNVKIGAYTVIAGCTGIAGSTTIGKHCMIGGHAAIAGHLKIADHVILTGTTAVSNSIKEAGIYSSGTPCMKNNDWRRNTVRYIHLNDMAKKLKQIEKNLEKLIEK
ncbi:MAG: UDP-3-O-(3-hydroxymyristoyl)glucosamine N-acyltransferase [Gammaproteobacteria bacterium]|jgi:UDP-3-O-[3-hydroxymyristoyl] glucosamine N-acyltransferase